jgi:hypothetical protein
MAKVRVRLPPHIAQILNANSSGWLVLERDITQKTTVSTLLASLVETCPGFRETVFNPDVGLVNEQIGVVLNEKLLTLEEISQTGLGENDSILLLPLYYGG